MREIAREMGVSSTTVWRELGRLAKVEYDKEGNACPVSQRQAAQPVQVRAMRIGGKDFTGMAVALPNAPLLLVASWKKPGGYVACGYWSMETAEAKGDCAAVVCGVSSLGQLLDARVRKVSTKAAGMGAREGMAARDFLKLVG